MTLTTVRGESLPDDPDSGGSKDDLSSPLVDQAPRTMLETIEVFRPGTHIAMDGKAYTFSEADVAGIAAAYDAQLLASPIVLGHPKTDAPAWGWAASFAVNDAGVLCATPEKVDPAFAEGVEAGRYRYVSMSLYAPADARNPKPGSWYPRHIGYLGGVAPAIKGLAPAFSEAAPEGGVAFSIPDKQIAWVARTVADIVRRLRDWLIDKEGLETADKVMPAWNDQWLTEIAAEVSAEQTETAWSEAEVTERIMDRLQVRFGEAIKAPSVAITDPALADQLAALQAREAAVAQREAGLAGRETAFAEGELQRGRQGDTAFVDSLVTEGRLPPGHRDRVLGILAHSRGDQGGPSFAEGESAHGAVRQLLEALGTSIHFSEFAGGGGVDQLSDPDAIASQIRTLVADAAARGETLTVSQAAAQLGR